MKDEQQRDDQTVLKPGLEIAIADRLVEPAQRQLLRRERQQCLVVERGDADNDGGQDDESEDRDHGGAARPAHDPVRQGLAISMQPDFFHRPQQRAASTKIDR